MKKTYTKKQITEAIAYWKNQLKKINESVLMSGELSYKRYSKGESLPDGKSFILNTKHGKIIVPADTTLEDLIDWPDKNTEGGQVMEIEVLNKIVDGTPLKAANNR